MAAIRGISITMTYKAWNTSSVAAQTGDSANHTIIVIKDGTATTATNSPSEVSSTNAPGIYKITLTNTEMDGSVISLGGKSSTSNVALFFNGDIFTDASISSVQQSITSMQQSITNMPGTIKSTTLSATPVLGTFEEALVAMLIEVRGKQSRQGTNYNKFYLDGQTVYVTFRLDDPDNPSARTPQ